MNLPCYGLKYNKLKDCQQCRYKTYCQEAEALEKVHVDHTTKDQLDIELDPISNYSKASNISGALITELLKLTDFDPLKFFTVIMRLGGCTYKEIASTFGISDVAVFKYCEAMPKVLKDYLKTKSITMLELVEAFHNKPVPESFHFQRTLKKMVGEKVKTNQGTTSSKTKSKVEAKDSKNPPKLASKQPASGVKKNG